MTKVLTVLPAVPVPATSGLQLRMLEILQIVRAMGAHSTVLAFEAEGGDSGIEAMGALCDEAVQGGRRAPYGTFSVSSRVAQRLAFATNAILDRPSQTYPFSARYDVIGAAETVARHVARVRPDVVILPSFLAHYSLALEPLDCALILDAPDVLTDLSRSFLRSYGARNPLKIPGLLANYLGCRSQERIFFGRVDEIWCTSEPEADRITSISPAARTLVVPNALPMASVQAAPLVDAPIVGLIGTYAYTPNLDAAVELVDDVLPVLRGLTPSVTVRIAGTGMPERIERRLRALPNVEVVGRVENAGEFVAGCRAMALPVRLRGGVPLKLVEAMAAAKPVVTTEEMTRGLGLRHGEEVMITDTAESAARALHRLLSDDDLARAMGRRARRAFEKTLSTESVVTRLATSSTLGRGDRHDSHPSDG